MEQKRMAIPWRQLTLKRKKEVICAKKTRFILFKFTNLIKLCHFPWEVRRRERPGVPPFPMEGVLVLDHVGEVTFYRGIRVIFNKSTTHILPKQGVY